MGLVDKLGLKKIFVEKDSETQLRIYFIGLQGILAFFFITPFAVMRFMNGEIVKGLIDIAIVGGMLSLSAYVVYGSGKRFASQLAYFFSAIYVIGATAVVYYSDIFTIMWIFPPAISCYFVLSAKNSIYYTIFFITACVVVAFDKFTGLQWSMIISGYIATCALSFVLSVKVVHDRKAIENYSCYDVLTGAKTRNLLIKDLHEGIENRKKYADSSLSVIIFDIDHFKHINDRKGHSIGDHALKQVTKVANAQLTVEQNIYRYGGEEFFVLVEMNVHQAYDLAERMRMAVESSDNISGLEVTISLGVAEHKLDESLESLTQRSDKALYSSKENGRNRSTIAA